MPAQGDIWWTDLPGDKRRPVLVVTRSEAIPVLTTILVAPITRTVRGIPTEVALGQDQGLGSACVATFDNLVPVRRSRLVEHIGELTIDQRDEICRAIRALTDC